MASVRYEKDGAIGILTVNRPQSLNSLNIETLKSLDETMQLVEKDSDLSCLIVTGEGSKAFVAGADISEMVDMGVNSAKAFAESGLNIMDKLEAISVPVIAAVNGYALGGGCELALSCDFIMAADNAVFSFPEVTLGILPGWGGTLRLTRRIGLGKAKRMIFTGERLKAEDALKEGLVDQVVENRQLMDEAKKLANKIATMPKGAVASCKAAINAGIYLEKPKGQNELVRLFSTRFLSAEQKDAMKSFLQKAKK